MGTDKELVGFKSLMRGYYDAEDSKKKFVNNDLLIRT
jgi:hypothetical protein